MNRQRMLFANRKRDFKGIVVGLDGDGFESPDLLSGHSAVRLTRRMAQCRDEEPPISLHRHRFPPEIISHAVWLYYRFSLRFRDVEEMLIERGVDVTYETIRQWSIKFGAQYARRLKRRQGRLGDTWHLDEVFVTINRERQYLWRAVDQDGDVIDILVRPRRDGRSARRFFRKLLKSQRQEPFRLVTDKLGSYPVTHSRSHALGHP